MPRLPLDEYSPSFGAPKDRAYESSRVSYDGYNPDAITNSLTWSVDNPDGVASIPDTVSTFYKYPDNFQLREEEYVYCNTCKDVAMDEEKLLKQKKKIDWLKEDIDSLFDKKLDLSLAANMIIPVLDSEIKEAMFRIKDDKPANDLLLLCHGDDISACILRRALYEFSMCLGLYTSMAKSTAFFGNVPDDIQDLILLAMPFIVGE
nr:hypothetical protein [Tanacetum cinerariifolium]